MSILTIIAIIVGPILAVQVQKFIERITQKRDEKRKLFITLMATRERGLLPEHVQALNMIDVTFSGRNKKNKAVVEAWAEYRDHLYNFPQDLPSKGISDIDRTTLQSKRDRWTSDSLELITNLLDKMAISLNYHFDKVLLKKGAYTPQGYGETETQTYIILRGLSKVFLGKPLPVDIVKVPSTERTEDSQKASPEEPKQDSQ